MQIATLNYQFNPKENVNGDGRAQLRHRKILTTVTNPQKKSYPRQSLHSDLSIHSIGTLPPIARNGHRGSSINIKGSTSFTTSSRIGETSPHPSHSQSRLSNNDNGDVTRRSVAPPLRPASKLTRWKFGHPIKLRPTDFYGPDKSEEELRLREESFVNDSVRTATQSRRLSIIPPYEPMDDPHLRRFFQSPIVLDIVRKTLNVDPNNSYKQNGRPSNIQKVIKRSQSNDLYDNPNYSDQRRTSKSSGYAKLNGYDCIPSHSTARNYYNRTSMNLQRWQTPESRLNHSTPNEKYPVSTNTSVTSFPTTSTNQLQKQEKKTRKYEKFKQLHPIGRSSSLQHMLEPTTSNIESSSTTKMNSYVPEQANDFAIVSNESQD